MGMQKAALPQQAISIFLNTRPLLNILTLIDLPLPFVDLPLAFSDFMGDIAGSEIEDSRGEEKQDA